MIADSNRLYHLMTARAALTCFATERSPNNTATQAINNLEF
jgi:hypothetical protein